MSSTRFWQNVSVALDNHRLGMLARRQPDVIPAWPRSSRKFSHVKCSIYSEASLPPPGWPGPTCVCDDAVIEIRLHCEDGECDIVGPNVAPSDVLGQTLDGLAVEP